MVSGADKITAKMPVTTAKRGFFTRKPLRVKRNVYNVSASVTEQSIVIEVADSNIVMGIKITDMVNLLTAANRRYEAEKKHDDIKKAWAEVRKNGR